jgi:hypothetical protein
MIDQTAQVYIGAYEAITGQPFIPDTSRRHAAGPHPPPILHAVLPLT